MTNHEQRKTPNRLSTETSPYLLQHAHNPVEWYPWGEEAFSRARAENKPIFLSIGYSACHWCHVMERESFENEAVAAQLNRDFVSIKVDREERPDVDSIYMQAVQMMTGHGGWPMSVFLTPEGVPFFGGTYFPPEDRYGIPGFPRVLEQTAHAWRERREEVKNASEEIRTLLAQQPEASADEKLLTLDELHNLAQHVARSADAANGGFGGAPKFPPTMTLEQFAIVARERDDERLRALIEFTLQKMARGGIYDQIGGGFHRYSVDAIWLVPHFEKMLYDNALLARLFVHASQWSKNDFFMRIATETLGWVTREMTSPEGGFYSTLDADSEGEEGKFYVWSRAEVLRALGDEEGRAFAALYDVTERGNWEGRNILNMPRDPQSVADDLGLPMEKLAEIASRGKCKLYGVREQRVRPGRDEKILAGWNGWMLAAFAEAAVAFRSEEYRKVVRANADFLIAKMMSGTRLYRSYKDEKARITGLLEDYSGVAWGLLAAFEALQEPRYLDTARALGEEMLARFIDHERGGFYDTPTDHEQLIARPKDLMDNATPAGNSVACEVFAKLWLYFGDEKYRTAAEGSLACAMKMVKRYPSAFGFLLSAASYFAAKPREIAITGSGEFIDDVLDAIGKEFVPLRAIASPSVPDIPLMQNRDTSKHLVYVCEGYVCKEPVSDVDHLRSLL